ncbi:hypothetical protein [Burkholderia glumae]|uniref:hypothetical protein n=1 Tax=Burkholderia glumae TaxID=337 RepID=UPI0012952B80|nr:hypothetical protein [Burkholderia glumae]MCM2493646.1 hypothetical protein [Burkholderia glumae]MCM2543733.1 hypothetical protein [Burkholderia glumae]MCM2547451.1 hypothetical protein [Burkholderia glumae]NVE21895.1 hypothetical protein [Burkholderia glumae]QGA38116.1 hypothetical protein GAS19_11145 [Burkholderia glumae]
MERPLSQERRNFAVTVEKCCLAASGLLAACAVALAILGGCTSEDAGMHQGAVARGDALAGARLPTAAAVRPWRHG